MKSYNFNNKGTVDLSPTLPRPCILTRRQRKNGSGKISPVDGGAADGGAEGISKGISKGISVRSLKSDSDLKRVLKTQQGLKRVVGIHRRGPTGFQRGRRVDGGAADGGGEAGGGRGRGREALARAAAGPHPARGETTHQRQVRLMIGISLN